MAKKVKNKDKKEELLNALKEMANSDDITEEDREKVKELTSSIENIKIYSRKDLAIGYAIVTLFRFIVHYIVSLALIGLFTSEIVLENKLHIFYVPLGISILFTILAFISDLLFRVRGSMLVYFIKGLVVIASFMIINKVYPIFSFTTIWVFYITLIIIIEEYIIFKLVRRKL